MEESHKYDMERETLKQRISMLQEQLRETEQIQIGQETFVKAIRKFMEMKTLIGSLLHELIEKTEVSRGVALKAAIVLLVTWNCQLIFLMPLIPQKHGRV